MIPLAMKFRVETSCVRTKARFGRMKRLRTGEPPPGGQMFFCGFLTMASAKQIKALLTSFRDQDDDRFLTVAMQVAAHEAKLGHDTVARDLRELIDQAKRERGSITYAKRRGPTPISQPKGELSGLLSVSYPEIRLNSIVLSVALSRKLRRVIQEYENLEKIKAFGLSPRRKLLAVGPPGTGKTMSASALAGELSLPLFTVRFEALLTKYMGEAAAKLSQIFDHISKHRGVYLFDEFDSIGSMRTFTNDVGEIRRVLNSFLQMIETESSDSLVIAATNHPALLDIALFRRFDDILEFEPPNIAQSLELLQRNLALFDLAEDLDWEALSAAAVGLSFAEITRACEEAAKGGIISGREELQTDEIVHELEERQAMKTQSYRREVE